MSKHIKTVNNVKVYSIDYLINTELSEDDLYNLFETPSLQYSLYLGMFRFVNDTRTNIDLINMAKTDDKWMDKNFWTKKQYDEYTNLVAKAFKNLYSESDKNSLYNAQQWIFYYGLTIK